MVIKFHGAPPFLAWFLAGFSLVAGGVEVLVLNAFDSPTGLWWLFLTPVGLLAFLGFFLVRRERVEVTEWEVRYYRYGKLRCCLPADSIKTYGLISFGPRTTRLFFCDADVGAELKQWLRLRRQNTALIATEDVSRQKLAQVWKLWNRPPVLEGSLAGNTSIQRDLRVLREKLK